MLPEQLGEGWRAENRTTLTFRTVLETAILAARVVVSPLFADIQPGFAKEDLPTDPPPLRRFG
jgi:hypothetical protein